MVARTSRFPSGIRCVFTSVPQSSLSCALPNPRLFVAPTGVATETVCKLVEGHPQSTAVSCADGDRRLAWRASKRPCGLRTAVVPLRGPEPRVGQAWIMSLAGV